MKIVSINSHPSGSTKTIMTKVMDLADKYENVTYAFWGCWKKKQKVNEYRRSFGFFLENALSGVISRITGLQGQGSVFGTYLLIKKIKEINPDLIHLHNLHLWTINIPMLFKYIKENNIPVVWTLHDCWPMTGHCTHFIQNKCTKWKTGCYECDNLSNYPFSYTDKSKTNWENKNNWFHGVQNMTIVTPSSWMAEIVKESFLGNYNLKIINNGIDLDKFRPVKTDIKKTWNIQNKYMILGIAFCWGQQKGLDVFNYISNKLDKDKYCIVLVGVSAETKKNVAPGIITIERTENVNELIELYSAADVFFNPTREDNFPTTNIEALACGTPVVTFNVGGCAEIIDDKSGIAVNCNDISGSIKAIKEVCEDSFFNSNDCTKRAKRFDAKEKYMEYLEIYKEITGD